LRPPVCAAPTCTIKVRIVSGAPAASVPRLHVTVPAQRVPPLEADAKLVPAGRGSETVTFSASPGPAVWRVRVEPKSVPAVTGLGAAVTGTDRSAGRTVVARSCANSDVLPAGSVAVAATNWGAPASVTSKLPLPLGSVDTFAKPKRVSPSPK